MADQDAVISHQRQRAERRVAAEIESIRDYLNDLEKWLGKGTPLLASSARNVAGSATNLMESAAQADTYRELMAR